MFGHFVKLALEGLKFYNNVAKGLKLKVRQFWELIPTFVEVTWEKQIGRSYQFFPPSSEDKGTFSKKTFYNSKLKNTKLTEVVFATFVEWYVDLFQRERV